MKKVGSGFDSKWLWLLRVVLCVLSIGVLAGWLSSYFVGVERYHSNWSTGGEKVSEEARWLFSNFGSFGYAWRSQSGQLPGVDVKAETEMEFFRGSPEALDNIHPGGFLDWHRFHFKPGLTLRTRGMTSEYGHFFVPYWVPFLVLALMLSGCNRRVWE